MSRRLVSSLARVSVLAVLGLGLSGCIGEDIRHGYVVDQAALATVRPGMSAEQVLQILGSPSTVSTVGNKSWYYISQTSHRTVLFMGESVEDQKVTAVYFNGGMKVERTALYGLQDGRIFDFIERKTASSGADRAFLGQLFRGLTRYEPFGSGSGTSIVPGATRGQ
ncbi:outer membrane protein assembly factor BamE [Methylobacterium sp. C25]|uniref:outer membrane protein assembly factor BamE n=1 Tax=Methylobacterium sp. C25 TaxID=2721622 RepID=UPI001F281B77|nr:outer membrane protein assembly factor BamE [Methylobacterium sp. C25]MCE4222330.1 outer membrane protein assembly factor BamE [Methylobacterium sp. C25]